MEVYSYGQNSLLLDKRGKINIIFEHNCFNFRKILFIVIGTVYISL